MLFSTLVSFTFVAAFVRAQTTVPVTKIVNIQDFKGNVFDLAFGSASELSPVQTLNHKTGATAQAVSHCFICFRLFWLTDGNAVAHRSRQCPGSIHHPEHRGRDLPLLHGCHRRLEPHRHPAVWPRARIPVEHHCQRKQIQVCLLALLLDSFL